MRACWSRHELVLRATGLNSEEKPPLRRLRVTTASALYPTHRTSFTSRGARLTAPRTEIISVCRLVDGQQGRTPSPCIPLGRSEVHPTRRLCLASSATTATLQPGELPAAEKQPCLQRNEQRLPPWHRSAGVVINHNFAMRCISLLRPARSISLRSLKAAVVTHALPGSGNANSFPSEVCSNLNTHIYGQNEANRI